MNVRNEREQVQGVLLFDGPRDLGGVSGYISECTEHANEEIGESFLLRLLGFGSQGIDCEHRCRDRERLGYNIRPVAAQSRFVSYLLAQWKESRFHGPECIRTLRRVFGKALATWQEPLPPKCVSGPLPDARPTGS